MAITVHKAPDNQRQSFGQKLNLGIGRGLEEATNMMKEYQSIQETGKQREAANKLGIDPDLSPELQKIYAAEKFKNQFSKPLEPKVDKEVKKDFDKYTDLQGALNGVTEMRNIRKKGNLGRGSSVWGFFGGETAKDRGQYETIGNSLISYATSIPIRNRVEFEKLAGHLSDPSITDSEAEGILNGLESIITNSIQKYKGQFEEENQEGLDENILNSLSDDEIKSLYQESSGDLKKAKQLAMKKYGKK